MRLHLITNHPLLIDDALYDICINIYEVYNEMHKMKIQMRCSQLSETYMPIKSSIKLC